jgi:Fic family protein
MDPLVRMAIAHYQFEAIHPFDDGNGRTGRLLNILMLVDAGLLASPILYLSRFIIAHKDDYYRLLLDVSRHAAWEQWVLFMLAAVEATAITTLAKIDAIQALQAAVREQVRGTSAGANSDLLDVLFEQPYSRIADVIKQSAVSRPTATKWLNELVAHGVLRDVKAGRERLFINQRFLDILMREEEG